KAYILGRESENFSSKNSLGIIDFYGDDLDIKEDINSSIEWFKNLKINGKNWSILPIPSVPELYPNMCNDMDYDWHNTKTMLSKELDEITSIWQCGLNHREIAHEKGVFRWTDKKFNSKLIGMNGKVYPPIIDKMLEFNTREPREDEGTEAE